MLLRFGPCELLPRTRELRVGGTTVRAGGRAFEVLLALAEADGEVLSRDALLDRVWRDVVVGDENLKVQVMALRKLIGAEGIVTVPGRGYRLGWPVVRAPEPMHAAIAPNLLGREAELERIHASWTAGARLVTLVGPSGVGKTRLALAALQQAPVAGRQVAAVAELAAIDDAAALPALVAQAMRLPGSGRALTADTVAAALAPLSGLLVLDNCEHLREGAAALARAVIATAPAMRVLATSQEPLGLAGETVMRLEGLAIGTADEAPLAAAQALFLARARAVDARLSIDDASQRRMLHEICRRLDGLPLALELAAARVPLLGLAGVRERLDQQLKLLTRGASDAPARHRTLRAALEWSHHLLDDRLRQAFRRLGVFADSFTPATAGAVIDLPATAAEEELLDVLAALVDKSLLHPVDQHGQRRLRMLSSARAFALERLADAGETEATQQRHADAVAAVFEASHPRILAEPLLRWLDRLWPELPELRTALRWCAGPGGDAARLLRLVGAAGPFWAAAAIDAEAAPWIERARPLLGEDTPTDVAARYWQAVALRSVEPAAPIGPAVEGAERAAELYLAIGNTLDAYRMLGIVAQHGLRVTPPRDVTAAHERAKALEDPAWPAMATQVVRGRIEAIAWSRARDWAAYGEWARRDAELMLQAGDEYRHWGAIHHFALAELALGRPQRAIEAMAPVVQRVRELDMMLAQWTRPVVLLIARIEAGQGPALAPFVREVATLLRVARAPHWMPDHFALWAAHCGEHELAARLLGWGDAVCARRGQPRHFHGQQAERLTLERLRDALAPERIDALRAEGRNLDDELALLRVCAIGG